MANAFLLLKFLQVCPLKEAFLKFIASGGKNSSSATHKVLQADNGTKGALLIGFLL